MTIYKYNTQKKTLTSIQDELKMKTFFLVLVYFFKGGPDINSRVYIQINASLFIKSFPLVERFNQKTLLVNVIFFYFFKFIIAYNSIKRLHAIEIGTPVSCILHIRGKKLGTITCTQVSAKKLLKQRRLTHPHNTIFAQWQLQQQQQAQSNMQNCSLTT